MWAAQVEEGAEVAVCSEHCMKSGFEAGLKTAPSGCETVQSVVGALVSGAERILGNGQVRRAVVSRASLWASEGWALRRGACWTMGLLCSGSGAGCHRRLPSQASSVSRETRVLELGPSAEGGTDNLWRQVTLHLRFLHLCLCLC